MTLRVGIVGGGVCGATLAALLTRKCESIHHPEAHHQHVEVRVWEKEPRDVKEGFNLQLDHNFLSVLESADPEFAQTIALIGVDFFGRTHRTIQGEFFMDMNVAELATRACGSIVRWDIVIRLVRSFAASTIEYGKEITSYEYQKENEEVLVNFEDGETATVDLLVVANGRYSALRGPTVHDLSPGLMNFRYKFKVSPEQAALVKTHERIYHLPDLSRLEPGNELDHLAEGDGEFKTICMQGVTRLGVLPLRNEKGVVDQIYFYGNFKLGPNGECPPEAKTRDGLKALFQPKDGSQVDALAQLCLDQMLSNVDKINWARCQTSPVKYRDEAGRVLFLGDAASAFFPMLTQGSAQACEDSVTACAVLLHTLPVQVPCATSLIQEIRETRRRFVMRLSAEHALHMVQGGQEAIDAFTDLWTGADGGKGRLELKQLLSDYPRFHESSRLAKIRLFSKKDPATWQ